MYVVLGRNKHHVFFDRMKLSQPIRRQFRVAAYSSPAISALSVTPVFMLSGVSFVFFPWAIAFTTVLVFIIWALNIWIYSFSVSRTVRYLLSYLFCAALTFLLFHHYFIQLGDQGFSSKGGGLHFHIIIFLAVDTVILILQDLVVTREKNAAIELENSRLRMRNVEAMNLQLMQQVQPHFLFNSLSALKSLIGHSPEQAGEYLVRLSGFLRASMSSHAMSVVLVGRELELCIDYLEMQQIRFGEALRFSIDVPAEVREGAYVPVFSLQLLIENAIKHNVLTRERPLSIRVVYAEGGIRVVNNLQRKLAEGAGSGAATGGAASVEAGGASVGTGGEAETSGQGAFEGTGLTNLRERYRALTGDPVLIQDGEHEFSVTIKVFDYEGSDH
jgi:two-component system LytT family sensor kinase